MNKIELIAKLCHEVNKAYCESQFDGSQLPWDKAPQWQKDSAIDGVTKYLNGTIVSPSESHKSWCERKREEGWKYGPVKDAVAKEHPCLVPYDELPNNQKAKDFIFHAICMFFKDQSIILSKYVFEEPSRE